MCRINDVKLMFCFNQFHVVILNDHEQAMCKIK